MDRVSASLTGKAAPYGHSCTNCVQAKRKCVVRWEGGPCERCFKTNRQCTPATTVRRRNVQKSGPSRTTRLEEKIDSLVSLMRAERQSGVETLPSQMTTNNHLSIDLAQMDTPVSNSDIRSTLNALGDGQDTASTNTTVTTNSSSSLDTGQPSPIEAEEYLAQFQTWKLQYFPFVYIPYDTSAADLEKDRPFLWLCIMGIGSKSSAQQQFLGNKIRQVIAQDLVVQSQKRLDLLLGLLAFIGCISSFLQKIDALRWTPHMDECLRVIDEAKECPNDEILVQQVRLQLVVEKVAENAAHALEFESIEHSKVSPECISELESVKFNIMNASPKNSTFLHLYSVELEVALSTAPFSRDSLTTSQRERLHMALSSISSWFNIFFMIPPAGYVGLSFVNFSQLIRCFSALIRLATLNDITWDKSYVLETANPLEFLNRTLSNLERVPLHAGLDNRYCAESDVFTRTAQHFRVLRAEWETMLASNDMASTMDYLQPANDISLPDFLGEEVLDGDWFMDLYPSTF
ncbi:Major facilitator superfamily domain general substrate transporter [Penicillium riverlandense]|uniref:Major facilitator superfamily domain general substrate transporter n=1 Tax=Penicillium riverlandense TaxID=1903569 RepID=UPI002547BE4D|nr:Major facilitator superfamily domain general substrate transporter [Penicillium riverlandense]KAJ5805371.1 Major facilitator superfamily domain general substrate transporter [Penicillium riverlandense]